MQQLRTGQDESGLRFDDAARATVLIPEPVSSVPPMPIVEVAPMPLNPVTLLSEESSPRTGVVAIPDQVEGRMRISDGQSGLVGKVTPAGRRIQRYQTADGRIVRRNLKTGRVKVRPAPEGYTLMEYLNFEATPQYDVDEYPQQVVLVADEQPAAPAKSDDGILSLSLTDIQPTLSYAWGEQIDTDALPENFHDQMDRGEYHPRTAPKTVLQWAPSNLWYNPLYFQDIGLERYGHTHKPWVQPLVSTGKFFGQVVGLPYQMVLNPPQSREYALGYYQPGEWAPKKRYQIPWNEEAAANQLLWVTGIILLVP